MCGAMYLGRAAGSVCRVCSLGEAGARAAALLCGAHSDLRRMITNVLGTSQHWSLRHNITGYIILREHLRGSKWGY